MHSKSLNPVLKLLFAVVTGLLLSSCQGAAACRDSIGCVTVPAGEPVRLGYMLVTSGENELLGADSLGGIEIAIDDRGGNLLNHPIELIGYDSGCSADGGTAAAGQIVLETDIVGIIGTNCSSAASQAIPIISDAGLIMIAPSTTGPSLTDPEQSWRPGFFRTAHNDRFQGQLAAEFAAIELGARTAATIHDGSTYADELQGVFADVFRDIGGTITVQDHVAEGTEDMSEVLTAIAADAPDVLYFPIFEPEGTYIAQQAAQTPGLEGTIFIGADGLLTSTFAPSTGFPAEGMYLSGPYLSGTALDNFLTKWDTKYGGVPPSGFHAFAYDATNILLHAIQTTAQVNSDGSLTIGRQALRDAVANIEGFPGLSGNITCNQFGDCATGEALAIYKISAAQTRESLFPPAVEWIKQ